MPEPNPILQTIDLTKSFGMVKAADAINVHITRGDLVGIVGANGSGKTTFLNLITGYLQPDHGRILIMGKESTGLPPRRVTKLGLARSFQIPQLYIGLSVLETSCWHWPPRPAKVRPAGGRYTGASGWSTARRFSSVSVCKPMLAVLWPKDLAISEAFDRHGGDKPLQA